MPNNRKSRIQSVLIWGKITRIVVGANVNQRRLVNGLIHDKLWDRCRIHLLNMIDDFNREGLGVDINFSLPAARITQSLDKIIK